MEAFTRIALKCNDAVISGAASLSYLRFRALHVIVRFTVEKKTNFSRDDDAVCAVQINYTNFPAGTSNADFSPFFFYFLIERTLRPFNPLAKSKLTEIY